MNQISNSSKLSDFTFNPEHDMLGKGNFGHVFKVKSKIDNQIYALKVIIEDPNNPEQMKNINREYKIMLNLTHQNIEKIYTGFKDYFPFVKSKCFFFVLEYIEGENLQNLLNKYQSKNKYIEQDLIIRIFQDILNGLSYLHSKNILHRDISPDNFMIEKKNNNIKITDFGLSAYYQDNFSQLKSVVGRKSYVCPEIYKAFVNKQTHTNYNSKCDIFSLGVTMFNLMTFSFPMVLNYRNLKSGDYKKEIDSTKYNPKLIQIIMKMLEENPDNRPTCEQMKYELNKIINSEIQISAFSCVINCLSSINQIYEYLIENKRNKSNKKLSQDLFSVIKSFIEVLESSKYGLNNHLINSFVENVSQKITCFKEETNNTPQIIIKTLFDYFLINLPKIYIYNNTKGNELFDLRDEKDIENIELLLVNQAIERYKVLYKNIFVNTFYFLVLKQYICPCKSIIKQDMDIECDIEFDSNGSIKQLLQNYEDKKSYLNNGKNRMSCKECGLMTENIYETKKIYKAPEVFIMHFHNSVKLDEFLEITESNNNNNNNHKIYDLKAIIISNPKKEYEVGIKRDNSWIYYANNVSNVIPLNDIIKQGNVCTAFYCQTSNEFSVLDQ